MVTPQRPAGHDTVMEEVRNAIARNAQQTPLQGGESYTMAEGTGFEGHNPSNSQMRTPSALAGAGGGATPMGNASLARYVAVAVAVAVAVSVSSLRHRLRELQRIVFSECCHLQHTPHTTHDTTTTTTTTTTCGLKCQCCDVLLMHYFVSKQNGCCRWRHTRARLARHQHCRQRGPGSSGDDNQCKAATARGSDAVAGDSPRCKWLPWLSFWLCNA